MANYPIGIFLYDERLVIDFDVPFTNNLAEQDGSPSISSTSQRLGQDEGVWPIIQLARYFTGSVRNRSLEGVRGGSSITAMEVCCPSSISRKFPIALVMFSLNFAPA
jgi:hypothetical protein